MKIAFYITHHDPEAREEGRRIVLICTYHDNVNLESLLEDVSTQGLFEIKKGRKTKWFPPHRVEEAEIVQSADFEQFLGEVRESGE